MMNVLQLMARGRRWGLAVGLALMGMGSAAGQAGNRPAPRATAELAADGTPFLIRFAPGKGRRPAVAARQQVLREQLGLGADDQLRPLRTESDALGFTHVRLQQFFKGVKVEHGQYTVHEREGLIEALSGEVKRTAAALRVQPALGEAAALQRALRAVGARRYKWEDAAEEAWLRGQTGDAHASYRPKGELVLVGDFRQPEASRPLVLAWKFNVYAQEPVSRDLLYVDARTGEVVLRDAIIKHVNAPGTMATRYLGNRTSTTDAFAGGYRLRETTRAKGVVTLNMRRGTSFAAAVDFVDADNNWTAAEYDNTTFDNAALDAHLGAQATQDYWVTQHGRDSYDNRGTVLSSYVHYSTSYENAFWDGTEMVYGDGATRFRPLTAVDVCGHEIGHAVCETTAGLVYRNESGALNEGFSDIWGACVEYNLDPAKQTWLVGEDISKTSPSLRSMSNPNDEDQPDTYLGTNWSTGTFDNGGVHTNSGVLNFWFYLLSVGGSGTNDFGTTYNVTGINILKAGRIAYRAESVYLTPTATYTTARTATLQAAVDLFGFGSAEVTAVAQAWRAVGLGQVAPVLSSLAPTSGPVGQVVTITGANLSNVYSVSFNGTVATAGTLISATQLSVIVPAGATTGPVTVTTTGGAATSPGNFTVTSTGPAPTIISYTPAAGQRTTATVVVTGTDLSGTTAVTIGGVAATFVIDSNTQLTVTVPAAATTGRLAVTTPGGTVSVAFTVLPYIASFTPASGVAGTAVTITGTSFTGALDVKFSGLYATFTVASATSITTTVPNGAVTGPITVRTPSGLATSLTDFTVTPSLVVASFSPTSGTRTLTAVTIRGVGFTGATALSFNGVAATPFTVASDTEIWATVPATATTGPISVTSPLGTAASSASFVVLIPGAPTITSFTPIAGAEGATVTVTGTNLAGLSAVRFNGLAATSFTPIGTTQFTTTVPVGATTGPISLTAIGGTGQSLTNFTVVPLPTNDLCTAANLPVLTCGNTLTGTTIGATRTGDPTGSCSTSIDAAAGVFYRFTGTGATTTIALCGGITNYDSKLFVFTGTCSNYSCVTGDDDGCGSGTSSTVTFNAVAGTSYLVYVAGYGSSQGSFSLSATCSTLPAITSFTPLSGMPGTAVTITGTNFTGATDLTFNNTAATFTVASATSISTTVPVGATTGLLRVTTPTGSASSATSFVVIVPTPVLTATPASLTGFSTTVGAPSTEQTLSVSGLSLTDALAVTAPTGFEVSLTAGSGYAGSLTITPTNGTVTATSVFARLTGATAGSFSGNVAVTSTGAGLRLVTVSGTVLPSAPVLTSINPSSATAGTTVTISGTGLTGATLVTFAGSSGNTAIAFTVNAAGTTLTVAVPAGAASGNVTVTTPGGTSNGIAFTLAYPDLVVTAGTTLPAGTYHDVTVLGTTANGTGVLTLAGALQVTGTLTVQAGGTLNTACQLITGVDFVLAAGATLRVCDAGGLAALGSNTGAIRTTGSRSFSPGASYVYNGTAAQVTGAGLPSEVLNLTIDNPQTVTLSQPTSIRQVLTVAGAGSFALQGQALTLLSDASGTALVVNSGTGVVTGTAAMQRYLDPSLNAGPGYRHYASPVQATTVADLAAPGFVPVLNQAYNTAAQPSLVTPFPNVFGYDEARVTSPANTAAAFDRGFVVPTATDVLTPLTGYTVHLPATALVDLGGTLTTGPVSRANLTRGSLAQSGWQLLGNPYPAPLDLSQPGGMSRSNLDDAIYIYQSTGPYAGTYRSYVNGVGSPLVAAMQGFFVRVSAGQATGSFGLTNAARVTTFGPPAAFAWPATDLRPLLQLSLHAAAATPTPADEATVYFEAAATPAFDTHFDAYKLPGSTGLGLSSFTAAEELAVNGLPTLGTTTAVPLRAQVPALGAYVFDATTIRNFGPGVPVLLLDASTGARVDLTLQPTYAFQASATDMAGRFSLFFAPTGPTATSAARLAGLVQLFPNPTHGRATLVLPAGLSTAPVAVALLNALGQVVSTHLVALTAAGASTQLETAGLAAGVYTVRIGMPAGWLAKKLVVE